MASACKDSSKDCVKECSKCSKCSHASSLIFIEPAKGGPLLPYLRENFIQLFNSQKNCVNNHVYDVKSLEEVKNKNIVFFKESYDINKKVYILSSI